MNKKLNKILFVTVTLGFMAMLVLSGCSDSTPATITKSPAIRIAMNQWIGSGAIYIADAKGFFAKEGVNVQLVNYDSVNAGNAAFASKQADANTTVLSDCVAQASAGVPLQVAWVFDESLGADVFVGNASIKTPADLKGKRIGLSYGTFGHVFVLSALAKYGISQNDVTIVNVTGEDVPKALADGKIDAGHTWDPFLEDALKNGAHPIFTSADTPGIINDVLEVHTSLIENRPNDVQALIRAFQDGMDYWKSNPTESNQIIAKAISASPADIPAMLQTDHILTLAENKSALTADSPQYLGKTIQTISTFFTQQKVIQQAPDGPTMLNGLFVLALPDQKQ